MSQERSVKDLFGLYTRLMERAMGIEPTSEAWEGSSQAGSRRPGVLQIPVRLQAHQFRHHLPDFLR